VEVVICIEVASPLLGDKEAGVHSLLLSHYHCLYKHYEGQGGTRKIVRLPIKQVFGASSHIKRVENMGYREHYDEIAIRSYPQTLSEGLHNLGHPEEAIHEHCEHIAVDDDIMEGVYYNNTDVYICD
jgi:hypothetical protein